MKVYDQNLNGTAAASTGGAQGIQRPDRNGGSHVSGAGSHGDRVELSTTLNTLSRVLDADRSDRSSMVSRLAAQYSRGEYQPSSAATASAMLSEALAPAG